MPASQARKQRRLIKNLSDAGMPVANTYHMDLQQEPSQLENYRTFFRYATYAEALTRIQWEGLPENVDERFLELSLFLYGQATIGHIDGEDLAQIASPYSLYDKQANYKEWMAISAMGDVKYRNPNNAVLIFDNTLRTSPVALLDPLIEDAAQAMTTASSNLIQQRYGVFFQAGKDNMKDAKRLSRMLGMGEVGAVGLSKLAQNISVNTINPDVADKTEIAFSAKKEYLNEIHSFLGTDFIPHEKKERLITDEAEASQDKVNRQREFFLDPRRRACEQMNELFGWNVSVHWNTELNQDQQNPATQSADSTGETQLAEEVDNDDVE